MKKWYEAGEHEDIPFKGEPSLEWIKKNFVDDTCTHEPEAYVECVSCIVNHLIVKCESMVERDA